MKTINKLMNLAVVATVIIAMSSCSKTQFQAGNLVGTWTMTSELVSETYVVDRPQYAGTSNPIKDVTSSELIYTPTGVTGVSTQTSTFDPAGAGGLSSSTFEQDFTATGVTIKNSSIIAGVSTITITEANIATSKNYSVTFNKDKTFSITNNTKTITSILDTQTGYVVNGKITEENNVLASGTWAYIGADKVAEEKNKERIGLWFTENTESSKDATVVTYTDTDANDPTDYTQSNTTSINEYVSTENGKNSQPNMIWKMVESASGEMSVTYSYTSTATGTDTTTDTDVNGTTATSSTFTGTETSTNTVNFSKN